MTERPKFGQLFNGEVNNTSIINEPIDFDVTFAVEEPQRESATARALRRWFKQDKAAPGEEGGRLVRRD